MQLRPRPNYYIGYFLKLNIGKISSHHLKPEIAHKSTAKKISRSFKNELNAFNCLLLKHLVSSKKKSPLITGKFEPSIQLAQYLKLKYNLASKYKLCDQLLSDHSFFVNRYFNPRDFCTIYKNKNGQINFQVKLAKPRKFSFFGIKI